MVMTMNNSSVSSSYFIFVFVLKNYFRFFYLFMVLYLAKVPSAPRCPGKLSVFLQSIDRIWFVSGLGCFLILLGKIELLLLL